MDFFVQYQQQYRPIFKGVAMNTEVLNVSGMTCGGCVSKVTKALKAINGVDDVNVSLVDGEAKVHFDANLTSSAQLKSAVQEAGYGVDREKHAQPQKGKGGCCG
jgi:copper chaperone